MTVVALAILLVCCLLVMGGALGRAFVLRRRLLSGLEVFRCKVRVNHGGVTGLAHRWPRRACWAEWRHDVLVLHRGVGLTWTQPLAVRFAEDVIQPVDDAKSLGLGPGAVALQLRLDDDTVIAVAAPKWAREALAGPFLAIAVHGLPPGMSERR